jgi:hypothetical protein
LHYVLPLLILQSPQFFLQGPTSLFYPSRITHKFGTPISRKQRPTTNQDPALGESSLSYHSPLRLRSTCKPPVVGFSANSCIFTSLIVFRRRLRVANRFTTFVFQRRFQRLLAHK